MNSQTALSARDPLAVLDSLNMQSTTSDSPEADNAYQERIIEAYAVAQQYAATIADPDYQKNIQNKLVRSNVRGSLVHGVRTAEDVVGMLSSVMNWREVTANLKDKKIVVLEGELPDSFEAQTAYATIREIAQMFGAAGLRTVEAMVGYQNEDEYYLCTMLRMPTNVVTVQLRPDELGIEHLHMWFAGKELSSRMHLNDGDNIVRCGSVIQRTDTAKRKSFVSPGAKDRSHQRAGR